jgi:hypothetical protein
MTPKEKAKELVLKFGCKKCALIAVNEIIKVCPYISKNNCTSLEQVRADIIEFSEYWEEVKQEIINL